MSRRFSSLVGALTVALLLAAVASAAAQSQTAHATRGCAVGAGTGYGYSYLTSLTVHRTSCATGRTVVKHHGHLRGWRCTKKRKAGNDKVFGFCRMMRCNRMGTPAKSKPPSRTGKTKVMEKTFFGAVAEIPPENRS